MINFLAITSDDDEQNNKIDVTEEQAENDFMIAFYRGVQRKRILFYSLLLWFSSNENENYFIIHQMQKRLRSRSHGLDATVKASTWTQRSLQSIIRGCRCHSHLHRDTQSKSFAIVSLHFSIWYLLRLDWTPNVNRFLLETNFNLWTNNRIFANYWFQRRLFSCWRNYFACAQKAVPFNLLQNIFITYLVMLIISIIVRDNCLKLSFSIYIVFVSIRVTYIELFCYFIHSRMTKWLKIKLM